MLLGVNTLFFVPGDVGGTEVYLRENLRYMASILRESNSQDRLLLFTTIDNDAVLRSDVEDSCKVDFVRLPLLSACRPFRIVAEQSILPLYIKRYSPDVLWSPGYTTTLLCPCPQAVTVHDLQYRSHPEDMSRLELITLDMLVRGACRRAQRVITVSAFSAKELVRHNLNPADRVQVVHGGVSQAFGQERVLVSANFAVQFGLAVNTPYLLCVAHSYPHKRLNTLVEAFALLEDSLPHHLVIVGKARRGETQLQEALSRLHSPQRVHRFYSVDHSDLISLFQRANVFVLPSVYEGFGLPVLEAHMAGVPVVTNRLASLPEVGGSHTVYAAEPSAFALAEAIRFVCGWSVEERERRIQEGKMHASRFTWQASAHSILTLLRALCRKTLLEN